MITLGLFRSRSGVDLRAGLVLVVVATIASGCFSKTDAKPQSAKNKADAGTSSGDAGAPNAADGGASGVAQTGGGRGGTGGSGGAGGSAGAGGSGASGGTGGHAGTGGTAGTGGAAGTGGTAGSGGSAGTGGTGGTGPSVTVMKLDTLGSSGWGAWQDGDGNWQQFSTAGSQYTFTPTTSRYGVAIVGCKDGSVPFVNVQYRTTAVTSLNACDRVPQQPSRPAYACSGSGPPPTISGTLTNIGTSGWLDIEGSCRPPGSGFGERVIAPVGGSTTYSVQIFLPKDFLFAIASAQGQPFKRIAVKRAVNASTLDIDFNAEAAPAATKAFAITGLGGSDTQSHSIGWRTSGSTPVYFGAATDTANAGDTYSAIDSSLVQPGDIYTFSAKALQGGGSQTKTDLWGSSRRRLTSRSPSRT